MSQNTMYNFSAWNNVLTVILKVWRQIENPTPSIDTYLLEEQSRQISCRSDLKRLSLKLFEEVAATKQEQEQQDE